MQHVVAGHGLQLLSTAGLTCFEDAGVLHTYVQGYSTFLFIMLVYLIQSGIWTLRSEFIRSSCKSAAS